MATFAFWLPVPILCYTIYILALYASITRYSTFSTYVFDASKLSLMAVQIRQLHPLLGSLVGDLLADDLAPRVADQPARDLARQAAHRRRWKRAREDLRRPSGGGAKWAGAEWAGGAGDTCKTLTQRLHQRHEHC